MSKHKINLDIQEIAQEIENIRHFLDKLERKLQQALLNKKVKNATGDGTIEGAIITENGNNVLSTTEIDTYVADNNTNHHRR